MERPFGAVEMGLACVGAFIKEEGVSAFLLLITHCPG